MLMRKLMGLMVTKYGKLLCSIAITVTTVGLNSCRQQFYQPKEPENLRELTRKDMRWHDLSEGRLV